MRIEFIPYLLSMAIPTYLIRMIPFTLFRKKIESKFAKNFFNYIPYAVLAAMTFPAIFESTGNLWTAIAGLLVAVLLSFLNLPMIVSSVAASVVVFLLGLLF